MSGSSTTCKRCGKAFSGNSCPFCTVTGVDFDALLNAEELKLLNDAFQAAPVSLVDMVSGKPFAVAAPICKIGRDLANNIALAGDRSMSRFHFQIRQSGSDWYIEDCGSRNGTFLNGSPIAVPRKLQNGDIVSAGVSRYRFTILSEDENSSQIAPVDSDKADPVPPSEIEEVSAKQISEAREAIQKLRGSIEEGIVSSSCDTTDLDKSEEKQTKSEDEKSDVSNRKSVNKPSAGMQAPSWLDEYVFPELQKLMHEKERLNGLAEEIRQDIKQIDRKIAATQGISQTLLSASGPELGQAVKQVFDALEWHTEPALNNPFELSLKHEPKIEAVARVVVCQTEDPNGKDFEALVNQQAVVWCQFNYEPKGIMIVQTSPELPPRQRPPLGKDFLENMRRKKICVIMPTQLLAMYRLVVLSGQDKTYFKEMILTTCGPLQGFIVKPQENRAATA